MFDLFAPSHLLIIAIAVLVFIGPKDLPRFMHMAGKWTRKARGVVDELRDGLSGIEQQGKLDELRREIAKLRRAQFSEPTTNDVRESTPHYDPKRGLYETAKPAQNHT